MPASEDLVWRYGDLRVFYRPELDGRGSVIAPAFVAFVRQAASGPYASAFEWCAGPAFLGFALLAEGLCERLTLSDVSPAAIECVSRTIAQNGLADRVTCHVGDNLTPLPDAARFDLVVANPPNFCRLNPRHSRYATYRDDLRPNDPDWRLHRGFYAGIRRHLVPDATLQISEVEPHRADVFLPRDEAEPYDARPRPAIDDFLEMIGAAGLRYEGASQYYTGQDGAELFMMTSRNPG